MYLLCSGETGFYISKKDNSIHCLNDNSFTYAHNEYRLEEDIVFGNICIEHISSFKYRCVELDTGKERWSIKLKGYLYHEIVLSDGLLYFGTAEYGGALYCVDILTGETLYSYNNGGCTQFIIDGQFVYLFHLGKKGKLVKLHKRTGEILMKIDLDSRINIDCPLFCFDGMIFTISYIEKKNQLFLVFLASKSWIEVLSIILQKTIRGCGHFSKLPHPSSFCSSRLR